MKLNPLGNFSCDGARRAEHEEGERAVASDEAEFFYFARA